MYVQPALAEARPEVLWALMHDHALGALVVGDGPGLDANHLPFQTCPEAGRLHAHIPKANPLFDAARSGSEALVIFQGPNHYISPGWQPGRAKHGRVAPSWNYAVAHAYGTIRFVEDEAWLRAHLDAIAAREEAGRPDPWSLAAAPPEFIQTLLQHIVGIEITVTRLVGKAMACQQYGEGARGGIVAGLEAEGSDRAMAMAAVIRERAPTP